MTVRRWIVAALMLSVAITVASSIAAPPGDPGGRQPADPKPEVGGKDDKVAPNDDGDDKKDEKPAPKNLAVKGMKLLVENATLDDLTFEEFCDWLSRETGAVVYVRWKVVEKEGVERACPIFLKEKDIRMRKLIGMVFEQVTAELKSVELAAEAEGNIITISTKKDLLAKMFARVYEVEDLLVSIPDFAGSGIDDLGLGNNPFRVRSSTKKEKEKPLPARVQQLIDVITTHIDPYSWKVHGGKGTITFFKGKLVIYNNANVHEQIGGYLNADEASKPEKTVGG